MSMVFRADAVVIAYDIGEIINILKPNLRQCLFNSRPNPEMEDFILDLWFSYTLHQFEVVSVIGIEKHYQELNSLYPILNIQDAVTEFWKIIDIPVELSGSRTLLHRFRKTLWIVYLDTRYSSHIKNAMQ